MMQRKNYSGDAQWEEIVGYSRAVRINNIIEVSGTTAMNEQNQIVGAGNSYEQTKYILTKIEQIIHQAGGKLSDVIRTRIFVTNISQWKEIGKAHGEFFREIKPATAMVEVSNLIEPGLLVEIEATAVLSL